MVAGVQKKGVPLCSLRVEKVDAIADILESDWDALVGKDILLSHRWQCVVEAHLCMYRPHYLLVHQGGQLVACAIDMAPPPPSFLVKRLPEPLLSLYKWVAKTRFCLCSVPFTCRLDGIICRQDIADQPAVMTEILQACDRFARRQRRPVQVFTSSQGDDSLLRKEFTKRGYSAVPASSYAVMPLDEWDSFADYLGALSSKRRREIRRHLRRAGERGVTFQDCRPGDIVGLDGDLYRLFKGHLASHSISMSWVDEVFFPALRARMDKETIFLLSYVEGRLAGFVLGLHDGNTINYPILGLDHALVREHGIYFLLHYQMIRYAVDNGFQMIDAGATQLKVKQRLGYHIHRRYYFIRTTSQFLDRGLQFLLRNCQAVAVRWLGRDLQVES